MEIKMTAAEAVHKNHKYLLFATKNSTWHVLRHRTEDPRIPSMTYELKENGEWVTVLSCTSSRQAAKYFDTPEAVGQYINTHA